MSRYLEFRSRFIGCPETYEQNHVGVLCCHGKCGIRLSVTISRRFRLILEEGKGEKMRRKRFERGKGKVNIQEILRLIDFYRRRRWDVSSALEFLVRYHRGTL